MKSYLIKNKKYTLFIKIIFCIFSFFFIDKVYALDLLGNTYIQNINDNVLTGIFTSGTEQWSGLDFINSVDFSSYNYDFIIFRLREFNIVNISTELISSQSQTYCNKYYLNPGTNGQDIICTNYNNNTIKDYAFVPIDTTISVYIADTNNWGSTCFFDATLKDHIICPKQNNGIDWTRIAKLVYIINTSASVQTPIKYSFRIDKTVYFGNKESTSIANAIAQLQIQQVNTINEINQTNQYISNNNTTQTQTDSTTALGGLSTEINSHLSDMNELTRFIFLPITFIVGMIDDTCQPLIWDIPLVNTRVVVPCMSSIYGTYFGTFVGIFSTIMTALVTYRCCIKLLATIKGVLDAEDDKLEVIDL